MVLRTNNVREYFEGPKRCQIAMDCKGVFLIGKANLPKRKVLVYQPFAEVDGLQNDVNQKVRETDCLKGLEPRLGGGQKYSENRSKSSNKRKCHEG